MPKHVAYNALNNDMTRTVTDGMFLYFLVYMLPNGMCKPKFLLRLLFTYIVSISNWQR